MLPSDFVGGLLRIVCVNLRNTSAIHSDDRICHFGDIQIVRNHDNSKTVLRLQPGYVVENLSACLLIQCTCGFIQK